MGFFDDAASIASSPLTGQAGLLGGLLQGQNPNDIVAQTPQYQDMQKQMDQAETLRNQLQAQAANYNSNLPNYQQQLQDSYNDQARRQLVSSMKDIDTASNSRGLLYSGLNRGQKTASNAQYATNLANNRANINQQTTQTGQNMTNAGIQSGFGVQQLKAKNAQSAYDAALAQKQAYNQSVGSLATGVGGLIGTALG